MEKIAGLREKILKSGVVKTILKFTKEGKLFVHKVIDPKEIVLLDQIGKGLETQKITIHNIL